MLVDDLLPTRMVLAHDGRKLTEADVIGFRTLRIDHI